MNVNPIYISLSSYEYLYTQCGDLPRTDGMDHWINNYNGKLRQQLRQIEDQIAFPKHVLDLGSGLGGIDALLVRRTGCLVSLVDGEDAGPDLFRHNIPFCSRRVVDQFMLENHIDRASYNYYNPQQLPEDMFDLVISFSSWCFHYPPEYYIEYVHAHTEPGALLIIDVRRERPDWKLEMSKRFKQWKVIENSKKYDRIVYQRE